MTVASFAIDHAEPPGDAADAGDDAGGRALVVVHAGGGERADLEERAAAVEQAVDAVADEQLAARRVALTGGRRAAERRSGEPLAQVGDEGALAVGVRRGGGVARRDGRSEWLHRHSCWRSIRVSDR